MTTAAGASEIEFVNDWSELESALYWLRGFLSIQEELRKDERTDLGFSQEFYDQLHRLEVFVPRLLTQYANLVELSFALTEGWETYATLNAPSGLYLPDNG